MVKIIIIIKQKAVLRGGASAKTQCDVRGEKKLMVIPSLLKRVGRLGPSLSGRSVGVQDHRWRVSAQREETRTDPG